ILNLEDIDAVRDAIDVVVGGEYHVERDPRGVRQNRERVVQTGSSSERQMGEQLHARAQANVLLTMEFPSGEVWILGDALEVPAREHRVQVVFDIAHSLAIRAPSRGVLSCLGCAQVPSA